MTEHSNTNGRGAPPNGAPPRRTIGLWTATALVFGNMSGSGAPGSGRVIALPLPKQRSAAIGALDEAALLLLDGIHGTTVSR